MIRKKHITLCFSLFLALSMVLGQLIPVAATDANTEVAATEEQMSEPEPAAEDVPEPEEAGDETDPVEEEVFEEEITESETEEPSEIPPATDEETVLEEDSAAAFHEEVSVDGYKVVANAAEGVLPEGAQLKVKKLDSESPEYKKAAETLDNQKIEYSGFAALDIHFELDGAEIEPDQEAGSVQIEMDVDKSLLPEDKAEEVLETLAVQHHDESDGKTEAVPVAAASDGKVQDAGQTIKAGFSVDSFSTFTITWITNHNEHGKIVIHYVTEDGVELQSSAKDTTVSDQNKTIYVKTEYGVSIKGYEYSRAYYRNNESKEEFDTIAFKTTGNWWPQYEFSLNTSPSRNFQNNETIDIYLEYKSLTPGSGTIYFDSNGGSLVLPDQTAAIGRTITLPESAGERSGYTFLGWADSPNVDSQTYYAVSPGGSSYEVTSTRTLYAIWHQNDTYSDAKFFVRLDGQIPEEPKSQPTNQYTKGIEIKNTVRNEHWIIDNGHSGIEGIYAVNTVTGNLKILPSISQIKDKIPNFDEETQYILWYVQKMEECWHIDGVLLDKEKVNVSYSRNCSDETVSVPNGYQVTAGTTVTVGSAGQPNDGTIITPERNGYTFIGWNTQADGSGEWCNPKQTYDVTQDVTFYAQWVRDTAKFTLSHSLSGNMSDPDDQFEFLLVIKDEGGNLITEDVPSTENNKALTYDSTLGGHTVTLADRDSIAVDLPLGTKVDIRQITQDKGYVTTHGPSPDNLPYSGYEHETVTIERPQMVHFNNHKEVTVPSGLDNHDSAIHGLIISVGAGLLLVGAIIALRRRINAI